MTSSIDISFRIMEPTDGPAISDLFEQTPDGGQISFTTRFKIDAYEALTALHSDTVGVVATLATTGKIVGMAMIDMSHRQIEGKLWPCALLNTLKVHPDHRRKGIAGRLSQWCIEHTRHHFEDEVVILADIQKNNVASEQTARHWSQQFVGQPATVLIRMRERPPVIPAGITVRSARHEELNFIAEQQNRFYQTYNLYAPQTGASLATWRAHTPIDTSIRDIYVAVDATGSVVAGAGVTERARLMALHVGRLPLAMQLVNRAIRLLPPNGIVDEVLVDQLWFCTGQIAAARVLWEWLRSEKRGRGSVLRTAYDPDSPLPDVLQLPFWLPKAQSRFAVQSPVPLQTDRLIYPYG